VVGSVVAYGLEEAIGFVSIVLGMDWTYVN
jgi:hypothetical protein